MMLFFPLPAASAARGLERQRSIAVDWMVDTVQSASEYARFIGPLGYSKHSSGITIGIRSDETSSAAIDSTYNRTRAYV
jgi:hypothetical protein